MFDFYRYFSSVIYTLRVSSGSFAHIKTKKPPEGDFLLWQGQKDLNPRHAVLEIAALPTELYPCVFDFCAREGGFCRSVLLCGKKQRKMRSNGCGEDDAIM